MPRPEPLLETPSEGPPDGLEFFVHRTGRRAALLGLSGEFDLATTPGLSRLRPASPQPPRCPVVIDLHGSRVQISARAVSRS